MGEDLASAVRHATDPQSDRDETEYVDWRDVLDAIRLNTLRTREEPAAERLRPYRVVDVGVFAVAANGRVRVPLPSGARTLEIFNETAQTIRRSLTGQATNGAGSLPILAGQSRYEDVTQAWVDIWSPVAAGINDGSANGITIEVGI